MDGIALAESGWLPDALLRIGVRRMLAEKLDEIEDDDVEVEQARKSAFIDELRRSPVALVPELANEQHYEVPPAFFEQVLGRRLKYSCALFGPGETDLDAAEEAMLALTCERAAIGDGMRVLELGCGWGSLTLYMAERYPSCRIVAVSNSKPQREFILRACDQRGFDNVDVRVADMNEFAAGANERFDRVVSVEMFEHMRNYGILMGRIASWLEPGGQLFVHHFSHDRAVYPYETEGRSNWMGRHFFSGGIMPSDDLLLHFQEHLQIDRRWRVSGTHYQKTAEAWLERMDARHRAVRPILAEAVGEDDADLWIQRWRMFFIACAELFGHGGGKEWFVSHLRFTKPVGGEA